MQSEDKAPVETIDGEAPFWVYLEGIVHASVCTTLDRAAATTRMNAEHGTGISSRWQITEDTFSDGTPNGCACNAEHGRRHWLFTC